MDGNLCFCLAKLDLVERLLDLEAIIQSTVLTFAIRCKARNGCLMNLVSIGLHHLDGLLFLSTRISRDGREFVLRLLRKINTLLVHLVVRQSAGELESFSADLE